MATTNLHPKRVTIFHQGCVEVYEKLGRAPKGRSGQQGKPVYRPYAALGMGQAS